MHFTMENVTSNAIGNYTFVKNTIKDHDVKLFKECTLHIKKLMLSIFYSVAFNCFFPTFCGIAFLDESICIQN